MPNDLAAKLHTLSDGMFSRKRGWDQMCQEVCEHIYPVRATYTAASQWGADFANIVMDGTTINVREELGNAVDSMLRQAKWFEVGTGDPDRDKRINNARSLQRATKLMHAILKDRRSNWQPAIKEADMDWVSVGQPVLSVTENSTRDFLQIKAWHPGDCAWLLGPDGDTKVMHRKFKMTAFNVCGLFKSKVWKGTLSPDIERACELEPDREFPFLHILMPAEDIYGYDGPKMRQQRGKKFTSLYIDLAHDEIVHESAEPLFGYLTPAWRRLSGMQQGFSPAAMNALPDIRALQSLARIIIEQGEKGIDPPIVGSVEVFTRDINLYAGGFTFADVPEGRSLKDVVTTLDTSQGLEKGLEMKQDLRALITDAFLLNKLYLPSARDMRELEVAVRTEEFRRAALPFFTPIETEYHTPLLGMIFDRAVLMGLIPPETFTADQRNTEVRFTFNSPLNEAEGKKLVEAYQIATQAIAAGSQVDHTVANLFDIRQATLDAVRGGGAPAEWMVSPKQRAEKDAEAKTSQQITQANAILQQGADAATNVATAVGAAKQAGIMPPDGAVVPGLPAPAPQQQAA